MRWLVYAARCGDAHALATLVRMHERLLATIVSDYFAPGRDREDLEQEGRTGLLEAIRNYDRARGVPFGQFAALCIRRKVIQALRDARRRKHDVLSRADSLDRAVTNPSAADDRGQQLADLLPASRRDAHDPLEQTLARETLHEIVMRLPLLTPRERDCLALVAGGASRADVVARIGGDEKAVDNAVQRARRKLQPAA